VGKALILVALFGIIAGCASMPRHQTDDPRGIWCEHNQPRRPTPPVVAAMSRPELDEMNAHNQKGVEWCGWRP
jgi:hypothetical protein